MRIVIDMQGIQAKMENLENNAYTTSFVQAIVRNRGTHDVILVLSDQYPSTISFIRIIFREMLSLDKIRVWHVPQSVEVYQKTSNICTQVFELIREAFLISLQPDIIHFANFDADHVNTTVAGIGALRNQTPITIMFPQWGKSDQVRISSWIDHQSDILAKAVAWIIPSSDADTVQKITTLDGFHDIKKIEIDLNFPDESAAKVINNWIKIDGAYKNSKINRFPGKIKPTLAFVTPLPPQRTGIADYSAELLPGLSKFYEIKLILAQDDVDVDWCNKYGCVRNLEWMRANIDNIDRVLYHIGNSPFHAHMLSLLAEVPGVVVLHDFYLGNLLHWIERSVDKQVWIDALYESHGYAAVYARNANEEYAKYFYPGNGQIVRHAKGVIVHSEYSRVLAANWYASDLSQSWRVIPLLRGQNKYNNRSLARNKIGIKNDDYLVCSFGFLGFTKLNLELIDAWVNSLLASVDSCHLVFVGENDSGEYGDKLIKRIRSSNSKERIRITGFVSSEYLKYYLDAADIAVQLRTQSRGETSAAVLDCMNHGLPVIVNANGSMAELDTQAVYLLPDEFEGFMLVDALEKFWTSPELREKFGHRARQHVLSRHTPEVCVKQYTEAIEDFYASNRNILPTLIQSLAKKLNHLASDAEIKQLAEILAQNHPQPRLAKRLFIDVTATCGLDLKTGIQRVVRALTLALIESPPLGYRAEPVRLSQEDGIWRYRLAKNYTFRLINCPENDIEDEVVIPDAGEVLLVLDFTGSLLIHANRHGLYDFYRDQGVSICAIVYDLLPVRMPNVFPSGADQTHSEWLDVISKFDRALCISKSVADDLSAWQKASHAYSAQQPPPVIDWFHLGADIDQSAPSLGMPKKSEQILRKLRVCPTFLMVGTIEPRKGYLQTIEAFTQLWLQGHDVNLVIVGNEGWKGWVPPEMCRDIPQTIQKLRSHPERGKRLFWLEGISDQYLDEIYTASSCIIAASYGEGFGLPLIEAAQHKLPIIARDIPVFREVAINHAHYFSDQSNPTVIAQAVNDWLDKYRLGNAPKSDGMPWLTWKQSAAMLCSKLFKNDLLPESYVQTSLTSHVGTKA